MDPLSDPTLYYASDPTLGGGAQWAAHSIFDVLFRWIPATILVLTGTAEGTQSPLSVPVTQPITTADVSRFLQTAGTPGAYGDVVNLWGTVVVLSVLMSLLLSAGVIYCVIRIIQIRHTERERYRSAGETVRARDVPRSQLRWNHIQELIATDNEQNWRLAILEADIMLNELLDLRGYKGETMSDKMKQVARGDWQTIDLAWEAHRMRNEIAHQGSLKQLSARDMHRVIGMYAQVFREHRFIE